MGIRLGKPMPECPCCLEEVKDGSRDGEKRCERRGTTKICACSWSRRAEEEKRYRENGTMLAWFLFALGWTLVPFRLRLEWHLANVLHKINQSHD